MLGDSAFFFPMNEHIKDNNLTQDRLNIIGKLNEDKVVKKQIQGQICQLEDNCKSVRYEKINQVKSRFEELRRALSEEENKIIGYIHEISNEKVKKLEKVDVVMCIENGIQSYFNKYHDTLNLTYNYEEDMDFHLYVDQGYKIPSVVYTSS